MSRSKLYAILTIACAAGYVWLLLNSNKIIVRSDNPGICLFKRISGIPCPSCGTTRSVIELLHGDILGAILWNPFGLIVGSVLLFVPFWITADLLLHNDSLFRFYVSIEHLFQKKRIAFWALVLVVLNWIWNIYKGF